MVADIEERMPADEFWNWVRYMSIGTKTKGAPGRQPQTAEGWLGLLKNLGHEVPK